MVATAGVTLAFVACLISTSIVTSLAQVPTINIPPGTCFLLPNGPISLDALSHKSSPPPMTVFRSHFSTAPQIHPNELIFHPPNSIIGSLGPGPTVIGGGTDNRNVNEKVTQQKEITQEKEGTKGGSGGTRNRPLGERPQTVQPPPPPPPPPTPTTSTASPFFVKSIYRRPSSRFDVNARKFLPPSFNSDFTPFTPSEPLINRAELEAIAQFEAALEEAKREGLYGLRTRTSRRLNSPPPKSPARARTALDNREVPVIPPPPVTRVTQDVIDFNSIKEPPFTSIAPAPRESVRSLDNFFSSRSLPPPEKSKFYQWLEDSSFLSNMQLAPEVNFTVLLPIDDAIDTLPVSFTEQIESNATKRRELLFYHIIPGSISVDELQSEEMVPTLLKKKGIRVARGEASHSVSMAGGRIIRERGDLALSSGKVRFIEIDRVLFPPRGNLFTLISEMGELSIFRNLIIDTGLKDQLESLESTLTIFAPSDSAFASVNSEAAALLTRDKSVARSFLLNHFSPSILFVASIPVGSSETVKNIGSQADLRVERPALNHIKVNDITVTFADLQGTNGVLHVIEHVLL